MTQGSNCIKTSPDETKLEKDYEFYHESIKYKGNQFFLQDRYFPLKVLGRGAFGIVLEALCLEGNKISYAIKVNMIEVISKSHHRENDKQKKEAYMLSSLNHKNIVKFE